jgi:hypothetical protein
VRWNRKKHVSISSQHALPRDQSKNPKEKGKEVKIESQMQEGWRCDVR